MFQKYNVTEILTFILGQCLSRQNQRKDHPIKIAYSMQCPELTVTPRKPMRMLIAAINNLVQAKFKRGGILRLEIKFVNHCLSHELSLKLTCLRTFLQLLRRIPLR